MKSNSIRNSLFALALSVILSACGGGSGSATVSNVNTNVGGLQSGSVYSGPGAQTEDVQRFKTELWDNISIQSRCGACHTQGNQAPFFVRNDDINLAYQAATGLVDFTDPANSRLVSKVESGHNCWLADPSVCGDIMERYISNWISTTSSSNEINLTAPSVISGPGESKSFPEDAGDFAGVYGILTQYCSGCHSDGNQPFASDDIDLAYSRAKAFIDLANPDSSRFVERLRDEFHNCWDNCANNSNTMLAAITAFADSIPVSAVDPSQLAFSKAMRLSDGISASTRGRVENNVIALWEFKNNSSNVAFDTSGVDPAINMDVIGDAQLQNSGGVRFTGGRLQGKTGDSRKLYDLIATVGEYSVEAWVVPENVTQDGVPIIAYSGGANEHNFMLGQTLYNYDYFNRSSVTDGSGSPRVSTPNDDEVLQATLQHVVATYTPAEGRKIYVNGELVSEADPGVTGTLGDWNNSFALVLGAHAGEDWHGTLRLLAIHNRALSQADIQTNFEAGVGQKFYLLFNVNPEVTVGDDIPVTDYFIVFEVQEFDDHSYLFNQPFFVNLGSGTFDPINFEHIRIGVNGREPIAGQAYSALSGTITENNQVLSTVGTIIPSENGPTQDEFFLTFDQFGANSSLRTISLPPSSEPAPAPAGQSLLAIKNFAEINASLSAMTGVAETNPQVFATYEKVKQQMPVSETISGFLPAHQMAITQLAVSYCNELTLNPGNFFGGSLPSYGDLANVSSQNAIINPILDKILVPSDGSLDDQPARATVAGHLQTLINEMRTCSTCSNDANRVREITMATCAAAYSSAIMLLQ